jgi:hypothetical protein
VGDLLSFASLGVTVLAALGLLVRLALQLGAANERARREKAERSEAYDTERRMRRAADDLGDDPDALRDWLRERGRE